VIGVDLGGTKIEAVALGPDGTVAARARVATPEGYAPILDAIADLVAGIDRGQGPARPAIGIGIPGSVGPVSGTVRNANSTCLNGRDLGADLRARLARPVVIENDANCFALAEAVAGAGRGADCVLGLILGTGIGSGIVFGGRIVTGRNRIAGEWGHTPLPAPRPNETPGPACWCGRRGCLEAWASGPGLAADHARATGERATPEAIAAAAEAGDRAARASLARHADRLGRALAAAINLIDPDAVVLGGGLSNLPGLATRLAEAAAPHIFSDSFETPIRANALGDSAGVIGAAWLAAPVEG